MSYFNNYELPKNKYSIDTVMERYIGKRKELILIEAQLEKLRVKIVEGQFSVLKGKFKNELTTKNMNESPENKEIQRLFKKLFQLKNFELIWSYTPIPNAMTPCKTLQILDKSYGVDKDGVDYNKKLSIFTVAHTGLFTHIELTAGEVLAVLLHEIGHNFYQSVFQILSGINPFGGPFRMLMDLIIPDLIGVEIGKMYARLSSMIARGVDFIKLRPVANIVQETTMVVSIFSPSTLNFLISLLVGRMKLNGKVFDMLIEPRTIFLYSVEKHADSFAVDYGYGPQLASGLNKMDRRVDDVVFNIPGYNWIRDFENLIVDVTFQTLSGYPTNHNRQTSAIKRLKEAKNDPNLPPRLRKELDDQIKEFETYYENYMSIDNVENKRRIFTWGYRSMINKVFKGNVDIRELFYKMDSTHPTKDKW